MNTRNVQVEEGVATHGGGGLATAANTTASKMPTAESGTQAHPPFLNVARGIAHALAGEVAVKLRGTLVIVILLFALFSSGPWRAVDAVFADVDLAAAQWWQALVPRRDTVQVVAISDADYESLFRATSPLDRRVMAELLRDIATVPGIERVLLDLDLSPSPGAEHQEALDRVLTAHGARFVLPLPLSTGLSVETAAHQQAWMLAMCQAGVRFGRSDIAQYYGRPSPGLDVPGSLSDVTRTPAAVGACMPAAAAPDQRQPAGLAPSVLAGPPTLTLADLGDQRAELLAAVAPRYIVVGGTWGEDDRFETPFGARYGVQLHAARLQGRIDGRTTAPDWMQVMAAIVYSALVTTVLRTVARSMERRLARPVPAAPAYRLVGHEFWRDSFRPLLLLTMTAAMAVGGTCLLAALHGLGGVWFSSLKVVGMGGVVQLFDWTRLSARSSTRVWRERVWAPTLRDWCAVKAAMRVLFNRPAGSTNPRCRRLISAATAHGRSSRRTALVDGAGAALSLVSQTFLPTSLFVWKLLQ